ncbi:GntR family transcriptional regulator [Agrobacterium rosae]|jgi:DNA-binding GntR family transcriptional regulator|uniref:GntR family transcriptional regulator n=1 Tax=Agrobacterium rosae TaxID=1972867 RepID=A0AAE5RVY6_9HYPH|nr:GntR family transcriptional regulator [Agrobacterium rosae]KAA3515738.1 GntR family transcriptional regulator [Agrobacterium rosae]KAA3524698.1 GntR family transcriptional regulator [Agrobacterium rosae]MBN7803963.1 GntR family transcriptional regulator [Agrobacterium rosae]MCM2431645.1 GntR family transcriptional regulator [Agrobacterium rosae]MDX8302609.1 GntR family transcriptional regulator [Agrobacterium rosae]
MTRSGQLDRSRQVALQVHEILRERIIKVELVPGTVLSRASLQLEFGISQTPVRDALMRLQEEGLVDVYPQYATVVAKIDIDHAMQAQFQRLSIELEAVRRLTTDAPEKTASELGVLLTRQKAVASPDTYDIFDSIDRDFHRRLYEMAGITQLWANVRRQSVHIDRLRRLNLPMPGKLQTVIADHEAIVSAIASGNPEAATSALRNHLSGTLSIIDLISAEFPNYIR